MQNKKLTAIMIGAGARGTYAYAPYAINFPDHLEFIGVAELDEMRRQRFVQAHPLAAQNLACNWKDLLARPKFADIAFICTQDTQHYQPAKAAMQKGYDIFIEKPISVSPEECLQLKELAEKYQVSTSVGHVLRYTSFFQKIRAIIKSGSIGAVASVQHNENVGHIHMSHSFVRGSWRDAKTSSPMILAKSCHDLDIITWLLDEPCQSLSSFGSLLYFRQENAPAGAPANCLAGCPAQAECPYYAPRIYTEKHYGWDKSIHIDHLGKAEQLEFLRNSNYGTCVFHSDNNVVDHQVVNMVFPSGATAVFTMSAFTGGISRTIKIMGTKGVIHGAMEQNAIAVETFADGLRTDTTLSAGLGMGGHGDGDMNLVRDFVAHCQNKMQFPEQTSIKASVQSHLLAFAAEESKISQQVINMDSYIQNIKEGFIMD